MNRTMSSIAAVLMALGLVAGSGVAANAAPAAVPSVVSSTGKVTVNRIGTATAPRGKKAIVRPSATASGNAQVVSKTVAVAQNRKFLARNVTTASLGPGTYSVTSTVQYKTWTNKTVKKAVRTTKLVSDGSKLVPMNCTIGAVETHWIEGLEVQLMYLNCTGAFDGVYKARAGYFPYTDDNIFYGVAGTNLWGDSFPAEPRIRPIIGGKFSTSVYPLERKVYKTTTETKTYVEKVWSKTQVKSLAQTLVVKAGR